MLADPQDTIVALSSAAGPGSRAIVRLSGSDVLAVAGRVFKSGRRLLRSPRRTSISGHIEMPGVPALPAELVFWPSPHTYTGQDLIELHVVSCPPLLDLLVSEFIRHGARAAQPGEFTLRAFLGGKMDLPRAEAVLAVIEAGTRDELQDALGQLAGGLSGSLRELRTNLLDLLADVEAALDFADEDISFVSSRDMLERLAKGMALVTLVRKQIDSRALSGQPFRIVLAGRPNAGKSSLFNALAGKAAALVSPKPGTTRDYLCQRLEVEGIPIELVDTAGLSAPTDHLDAAAQHLGSTQAKQADLVLLCVDAAAPNEFDHAVTLVDAKATIRVWTKADLAEAPAGELSTSAVTRKGLDRLRSLLAERARAHRRPALAPSLSRCRGHVEATLTHLRQAHQMALFEEPPELLALELRTALDELGALVGAVYTDDLLDRIFSRFCIGK